MFRTNFLACEDSFEETTSQQLVIFYFEAAVEHKNVKGLIEQEARGANFIAKPNNCSDIFKKH